MRLLTKALIAATLMAPLPALSQGLFSPAISVNEQAVTNYEIGQRSKLLEVFRTQGDLTEKARDQLVDDVLRNMHLASVGFELTENGINTALEDFAGRASQTYPQFVAALSEEGIAEETIRDYIVTNVTWREYIRNRFGRSIVITDADIEAALSGAAGVSADIQVLVSEIIIAAPPERAAEAMAIAEEISTYRSTDRFSEAATRYSALQSRAEGGRLPWRSISEFPAGLQGILTELDPGQVTNPIEIPNGIALFQLRSLREVASTQQAPATLEYAVLEAAAGDAILTRAAQNADTCDDLYGIAKDQTGATLWFDEGTPSEIESDIALVLAGLDPDEYSTALSRNGGQTQLFVMLCSRLATGTVAMDRTTIENQIRTQQLTGFADRLLADLRAQAAIIDQ